MRGRLLITGFGPFPGMPRNPSAALARRVAAEPVLRLHGAPRVVILRTAYAAIPDALEPALAVRPAAVLMFGVAARAKRLRVEVRAANRASRLFPDASGATARRLALDPGGPPARRCAAGPQALAILRRHGLAAAISREAGRYLCNASYYRALAEPCPVLFVHTPPVPATRRPRRPGRAPTGEPVRALAAVAKLLLRRARTVAGAGPRAR
ncbi:pyroglutamyl-peptidase I family protein [Methylobacterium sp. A54F]